LKPKNVNREIKIHNTLLPLSPSLSLKVLKKKQLKPDKLKLKMKKKLITKFMPTVLKKLKPARSLNSDGD